MAKKKYYAVRVGKTAGIYTSWEACEEQVKGVPGAKYKSFGSKEEAEAYYRGEEVLLPQKAKKSVHGNRGFQGKEAPIRVDTCDIFAYIDGSYDKEQKAVGYGGVIVHNDTTIPFSKGTKDPSYSEYWNIAGELLAAGYVVRYALQQGVASCALYYDCQGIKEWALGRWRANTPLTKKYVAFMKKARESLVIEFYKVAAHTGVQYNEQADQLAKEGTRKA